MLIKTFANFYENRMIEKYWILSPVTQKFHHCPKLHFLIFFARTKADKNKLYLNIYAINFISQGSTRQNWMQFKCLISINIFILIFYLNFFSCNNNWINKQAKKKLYDHFQLNFSRLFKLRRFNSYLLGVS